MKLLNCVLLFFTVSILYPQSGKAIYKKEYIIPKERFEDIKIKDPERYHELMDFNREIVAAADRVEFELKFSGAEARFEPKEIMSTANIDIELGIGPKGGVYYNNFNTQERLWRTDIYFGQDFIIELEDVKWELTNETKIIAGYKSRKAIGNKIVYRKEGIRKYPIEAWYVPKIPVGFGPLGYSGLPGLIVSLTVQNRRYYLKEVELYPEGKSRTEINRPMKGKQITYKEFYDILNGVLKDRNPNR